MNAIVSRELTEEAKQIIQKIKEKTITIGVIGLGYVGLPLALEKAKAGYQVIGFDIQEARVALVNEGKNYIGDIVDEDLVEMSGTGRLTATTDYSFLQKVDAIAICVPTPLDNHQQPDISYVESSCKQIAAYLRKNMLVVLESTTYPGTTEEIVKPILEESGLKCGVDFFLAYSPERVDPGNRMFNTKNTPKVVGGITASCTAVAASLYKEVLEGEIHEVSSPAVAEMEKILENTYRHINIALANEMAILCSRMGIDVWEVIDAAATKPYGFMPFYPGPGLGGHCIPIDPFYLTWKAREYNYHTRLIELAGEINNSMPEFVVHKCLEILNTKRKSLNGAQVLILGVAYKKDVDDVRESPILSVMKNLDELGALWKVVDPHVEKFKYKGEYITTEAFTIEDLQNADLVLLGTDHTSFDYEKIAEHASVLFDTRNAMKKIKTIKAEYYKL